jgi:hypothetical protein
VLKSARAAADRCVRASSLDSAAQAADLNASAAMNDGGSEGSSQGNGGHAEAD